METQKYIDLIKSQIDTRQPLYMLVDPLKSVWEHYPISIPSLKGMLGKEAVLAIPRADLQHTPDDCPHLVLLANGEISRSSEKTQAATSIFEYAVKYAINEETSANRRYVCGWLQSHLDQYALAQNLADRMLLQHNEQKRVFALYEPLRQELIAYACHETDPDIHERWLGEVSKWIVPASNQGLLCFKTSPSDKSIVLPAQAISSQIDTPLVANTLRVWQNMTKQPMSGLQLQQAPLLRHRQPLPQGAAYAVYKQLHAGFREGLRQANDLTHFAIMRLLVHPRFETSPLMQTCIEKTIRGEQALGAQLAAINHAHWMAMLAQLG